MYLSPSCVWCLFIITSCILSTCTISATPLVVGHRGYPSISPENTMPSFILAAERGVNGIETDLRLTKDGVLVVLHDETLDRTTNCTGPLSNYTWDELQECDASYDMPKFTGTKIPLFSEVIEFARNHSLFVVMDYKSPIMFGKILAGIITNMTHGDVDLYASIVSNLIGSCWTPEQEEDIATYLPGSPVQTLTSGLPWAAPGFWQNTIAAKARGFSIEYGNITSQFVAQAHQRLMSVTVWTADSTESLTQLVSWNVDAIITNECGTLIDILKIHNNPSSSSGEIPLWIFLLSVFSAIGGTAAVAVSTTFYCTRKYSVYKRV